MRVAVLLIAAASIAAAKSIPHGYTLPIPADIFIKDRLKTHIGELRFDDGIADEESAQKVQNEYLYILMVRSYINEYKAVWLEILKKELLKNGVLPNETLISTLSPLSSKTAIARLDPKMEYTVGLIDLSKGNVFVWLPDSTNSGIVINAWGETVAKIESGKRYLIVPANNRDQNLSALLPKETNVVASATKWNYFFHTASKEKNATVKDERFVFMPQEENTTKISEVVDLSFLETVALVPRSGRFFKLLADLTHSETILTKHKSELDAIGIDPAKAFMPNGNMRALYTQAAVVGGLIVHQNHDLAKLDFLQIQKGVREFEITKDANGEILRGEKGYMLYLPREIASKSWSVTLYDTQTESMMQNPQNDTPYIVSENKTLLKNDDGSIELFFTPNQPNDSLMNNTISTVAGKNYFAIFRIYNEDDNFQTDINITIQPLQKEQNEEDIEVF